MAMKARYTVINGEVIAEERNGVRRLYVPDPLGSTVALLDSNQAKTDTFSYWPYGEEASRTGTTPTPFRFVGTRGYYRDRLNSIYVRARTYRPEVGRWLTKDPRELLLDGSGAHSYGGGSPVTWTDPSGLVHWLVPVGVGVIVGAIVIRVCIRCIDKVEADIPKPGTDKYLHCMVGCLGRMHCSRVCVNWTTGWLKEHVCDRFGRGTIEQRDIDATNAGVACGAAHRGNTTPSQDVQYCVGCCKQAGWGPDIS